MKFVRLVMKCHQTSVNTFVLTLNAVGCVYYNGVRIKPGRFPLTLGVSLGLAIPAKLLVTKHDVTITVNPSKVEL